MNTNYNIPPSRIEMIEPGLWIKFNPDNTCTTIEKPTWSTPTATFVRHTWRELYKLAMKELDELYPTE